VRLARTIAVGVAAAALLTGCIEEEATDTAPPADWAPSLPTSEPVELDDDALSDEALSILVFRLMTSDLDTGTSDNLTDAEIVDFAGGVCDLAAYSDDLDEFLLYAVAANEGTGMSDYDAGAVIGALIGAFCPEEGERFGWGS
jgi:hypothetical protein